MTKGETVAEQHERIQKELTHDLIDRARSSCENKDEMIGYLAAAAAQAILFPELYRGTKRKERVS